MRRSILNGLVAVAALFGLGLAANGDLETRVGRAHTLEAFTQYLPNVVRAYEPGYQAPFGVTMYGDVDDAYGLERMRAAGSKWVVTVINWRQVQPTAGSAYDWSDADGKIVRAAAAGMRVFVLFNDNPTWVSNAWRGVVPPERLTDLENVVRAMALRYNGQNGLPQVNDWSFYGEPDFYLGWGYAGVQYAQMLQRLAPVIHLANPEARVLIGGLAYDLFTTDTPWPGFIVRSFLTDTLQTLNTFPGGASAYIDAFAFHYYPVSTDRWPTLTEKAQELIGVLQNHGVGHLPVVVPEIGKPSQWPAGDTPVVQARWLVQNFVRGLALGIEQLEWFKVFDTPDDPGRVDDDLPRTLGLFVELDLNQPKPAYTAYGVLARELNQAHYKGRVTTPGVEGYEFWVDNRVTTVAWGTTDVLMPVDYRHLCVRQVTLLGTATQIIDGGAGDWDLVANGQIRIPVQRNEPVYVSACP